MGLGIGAGNLKSGPVRIEKLFSHADQSENGQKESLCRQDKFPESADHLLGLEGDAISQSGKSRVCEVLKCGGHSLTNGCLNYTNKG